MAKQNKNDIEYDRIQIAKLQYSKSLGENKLAEYKDSSGENIRIGTVREVVTDDFGQKAYVIQSEDKKEVSVIYRGSDVPGAKGSAVDWLGNDFIFTCKNKSVS